jgi:hypothetical protein
MKDFWQKIAIFKYVKFEIFLLKTSGKETRGGELYAEKKIIGKFFREAEKTRKKPGFLWDTLYKKNQKSTNEVEN